MITIPRPGVLNRCELEAKLEKMRTDRQIGRCLVCRVATANAGQVCKKCLDSGRVRELTASESEG